MDPRGHRDTVGLAAISDAPGRKGKGDGPAEAEEERKRLAGIYYQLGHPASFGSVEALKRASGLSRKRVKLFLMSQPAYTLHKQVRHRFPRNKIVVSRSHQLWEADLADMQKQSRQNRGYRYWLTVIDAFSKKLWVRPLKQKTGPETKKAFEDIMVRSRNVPDSVRTDKGKEFLNKHLQKLFRDYGIQHYVCREPSFKCSIVERVLRSLKLRLFRYFTARNTQKYIDVLQDIVRAYNDSYHRSIKMSPNSVNASNQREVYQNLYGIASPPPGKFVFRVGDYVRISKPKRLFKKSSRAGWSTELFRIKRRLPRRPPVYIIADQTGEEIQGVFYAPELQRVLP